jgi:hypothetical protein
MGWTVQGSNAGGSMTFCTHPDRPWGPPSLLYNGYRVSFSGVKRTGRGIDHPTPSSTDIKERVRLYLYSPSELSEPALGWTLLLPYVYSGTGICSKSHDQRYRIRKSCHFQKTIILRRLYLCLTALRIRSINISPKILQSHGMIYQFLL